MRRIAVVTGSRGEWGYLRPVLREMEKEEGLDFDLIVTNLHLLPEFGYSVQEIERDGFPVRERIYMALDGYTPGSMSKSLGIFLSSVTDALVRLKPDLVLLAGDRGEQLMAAIAAATMNIPVAHIQAGELSGNIDGMSRHAIARFAHVHFASNEDAAERLRRSGEDPFRIHLVGAPQLDEIVKGEYAPPDEVAKRLGVDVEKPIVLLAMHPVTEEFEQAARQTEATLEAAVSTGHQTVAVFPNNDAGSEEVRRAIERHRRPNLRIERNMPRNLFLGLMRVASVMVGNSSSAIIEAPVFKLPAVNVGTRQRGRFRGSNVIDVPPDRDAISRAILKGLDPRFRKDLQRRDENPYQGDGEVAARIVKILKSLEINERLLKKQLTF